MTKLCTLSICLGLLAAFTACTKDPGQTGAQTSQQSASPSITFPGQNGWAPTEACAHLSDKLNAGEYKSEGGNDYRCLSSAKELEAGPPLPNKIIYYAKGKAQRAGQVGLVLYVNNPESADMAHNTLLEYSRELSEKALGVPLSAAVEKAISAGTTGRGRVDTTRVEILRHASADGKGYELHYVITPRL